MDRGTGCRQTFEESLKLISNTILWTEKSVLYDVHPMELRVDPGLEKSVYFFQKQCLSPLWDIFDYVV